MYYIKVHIESYDFLFFFLTLKSIRSPLFKRSYHDCPLPEYEELTRDILNDGTGRGNHPGLYF